MMLKLKNYAHFGIVLLFLLPACSVTKPEIADLDRTTRKAWIRTEKFIESAPKDVDGQAENEFSLHPFAGVDTVLTNHDDKIITIKLNRAFAQIPFRTDNTNWIINGIQDQLGWGFRNWTIKIEALNQPLAELIPNLYRENNDTIDRSRMPAISSENTPFITNESRVWDAPAGLQNNHIALWNSHGWYYEHKLKRWEWQRSRNFQTVEDLLPTAFVLPYLTPMLENAGATVWLPRERDLQTNEVIVDNDQPFGPAQYIELNQADAAWQTGESTGFGIGNSPYIARENPFKQGSFRWTTTTASTTNDSTLASELTTVVWMANIPEKGEYAVYISYQSVENSTIDAHYEVHHAGTSTSLSNHGITTFKVNQQMAGGTWVYLGKFLFEAGQGKVVLNNISSKPGKILTADAVRFGGGMGNIARGGATSGRPRFMEGARYYLQFAGMPDSLVYNVSDPETNDYIDDYQSRGEWVNYLKGAPFGPNKDREAVGLNVPIDLSLAFHTDAGTSITDTTIGTLMIYSSEDAHGTTMFPDEMSRFANRDLADIMQTQLVDDIQALYNPNWTRRAIWDRNYSEAYRPNVPAALLELLSHQSFTDMRYAQDPQFRFDASRAIYKSMVQFIAFQDGREAVIQPLPADHLSTIFTDSAAVKLTWRSVTDPLEKSADPTGWVVYTRLNSGGFDNGVYVSEPKFEKNGLAPGQIYSFKVTAVNAGGQSMDSEIVSVSLGQSPDGKVVLIVNGFDRVSAPAVITDGNQFGFNNTIDAGVADKYDLNFIGKQYSFNPDSPWLDDDEPGHGASASDYETQVVPGNTFDFAYRHGQAILNAGYGFVTISDESVMAGDVNLEGYAVLDLILGEEKVVMHPDGSLNHDFMAFPPALQQKLASFTENGGNLFVSGAHVTSDLVFTNTPDSANIIFADQVLGVMHRTDFASKSGLVITTDTTVFSDKFLFQFNGSSDTEKRDFSIYQVESPDGLEPTDSTSWTILRYGANSISAGVAHSGDHRSIVLGFPFETLLSPADRNRMMADILRFLFQ